MIGQINRGSQLGDIIYNMCKQEDIKVIVEIGTWNGMGTTKCIYDSIIDSNKKNYIVYSLESNIIFYNQAINNLPKLNNFNIILGRIIEPKDIIDIDGYGDEFFKIPGCGKEVQKSWLMEDIENYKKIKNVIDIIPKKIDLLILDGGEFSSLAEYEILKDRTTYFILDDTLPIKNHKVSNLMKGDKKYEILYDIPNDRNGFLISKKLY